MPTHHDTVHPCELDFGNMTPFIPAKLDIGNMTPFIPANLDTGNMTPFIPAASGASIDDPHDVDPTGRRCGEGVVHSLSGWDTPCAGGPCTPADGVAVHPPPFGPTADGQVADSQADSQGTAVDDALSSSLPS